MVRTLEKEVGFLKRHYRDYSVLHYFSQLLEQPTSIIKLVSLNSGKYDHGKLEQNSQIVQVIETSLLQP